MKNKDLLLIGGAALVLYLIMQQSKVSGQRGYVIKKAIDTRPGCHQGEIASFIKRSI